MMGATRVDPTDPTFSNPGGKPPRQETEISMLIDLRRRVDALEQALTRNQGITFVSPDGRTTKTLSIDNSGNPVWT